MCFDKHVFMIKCETWYYFMERPYKFSPNLYCYHQKLIGKWGIIIYRGKNNIVCSKLTNNIFGYVPHLTLPFMFIFTFRQISLLIFYYHHSKLLLYLITGAPSACHEVPAEHCAPSTHADTEVQSPHWPPWGNQHEAEGLPAKSTWWGSPTGIPDFTRWLWQGLELCPRNSAHLQWVVKLQTIKLSLINKNVV